VTQPVVVLERLDLQAVVVSGTFRPRF